MYGTTLLLFILCIFQQTNVLQGRPDGLQNTTERSNRSLRTVQLTKQLSVSEQNVSGRPSNKKSSMPVVFPDSFDNMTIHSLSKREFKPKSPCNDTFCEEIEEYPENYIDSLLGRTNMFDRYFKDQEPPIAINNRINGDTDPDGTFQTLCDAEMKFTFPRSGKTKEGKDVFIVNTKKYHQMVAAHTCKNGGGQCLYGEYFPLENGKVSRCSQRFLVRRFVALEPNSGEPTEDDFMVPSCCVCTIQDKKD